MAIALNYQIKLMTRFKLYKFFSGLHQTDLPIYTLKCCSILLKDLHVKPTSPPPLPLCPIMDEAA